MAQMGKLDPVQQGFAEGLSDAAKMTTEKISNSRLIRLFNAVSAPLELPSNEFAMQKNPTLGRDRGSYVQISEKMPTASGGTLQTIEIGSGMIFVDMKKQEYGVKPSEDNIKILIERDDKGESKLSASIRGQELEGFDKLSQKDAAKMVGQMVGRVQLGQVVPTDDVVTRLSREVRITQSINTDPTERKVGTFRVSDVQNAMKNASP